MRLLLYLEYRQLANRIAVTLRTPKRLIPTIFMLVYFAWIFGMQLLAHGLSRRAPIPMALDIPVAVESGVFLLMSLVMVFFIARSFSDSMLAFPLSDIDYLFASPIPRQAILTLKLLGMYARAGLWSLFLSVFLLSQMWAVARPSFVGAVTAWVGIVLFAAFVVNTSTLINLVATYREGGKWWLSFAVRAAAYAVILGIVAGILYTAWQTGSLLEGMVRTVRHPGVVLLLLPAKWGSDLLLTVFTGLRPEAVIGSMGLGSLAVASYILVILRKENPYEPSLSASIRLAAIRSARRAGDVFRVSRQLRAREVKSVSARSGVPAFGRGATAIVWKNLNVTMRVSGKALVLVPIIAGAVLVISKVVMPGQVTAREVEGVAAFILGYAVFIASTMMLQSFRGDLKQANILKPIPIPSWQIVAAQTVQGALVVAALSWTILILVAVTYGLAPQSLLLLMAVCLPFVTYAALTWQATAAIVFPNLEDQAQHFLGGLLSMLVGGLSLAPPLIIGFTMRAFHLGVIPIALAVVPVSVGIAVIGIIVSGQLYARFDPTDE